MTPLAALATERPRITVHRDPNCDCCTGWIEHLERSGFPVTRIETNELDKIKARLGVPEELAACHTAEGSGYVIEGHVPAAAIDRLLAERPKARGLAVPGMPLGSPGMSGPPEAYDVILADRISRKPSRDSVARRKSDWSRGIALNRTARA